MRKASDQLCSARETYDQDGKRDEQSVCGTLDDPGPQPLQLALQLSWQLSWQLSC
jgi:hypothetical protein